MLWILVLPRRQISFSQYPHSRLSLQERSSPAVLFDALTVNDGRSLVRVKLDGSLDSSFNPGTARGEVLTVALQPDGKIVIGGVANSQLMQHRIARLNPYGSPDTGFDPGTGVGDNFIDCIALQTDGQIVIGGAFSTPDFDGPMSAATSNAMLEMGLNGGQLLSNLCRGGKSQSR